MPDGIAPGVRWVAATLFGLVGMGIAALIHEGATVMVEITA
jgi:hypothetical protein